tara:strand:+ start:1228 stop:1407 length:180 start_codon:yes stop_codon:yes gene_type:complete
MSTAEIVFLSMFVSLIVFLVLREVICWYFKINKRLSVMIDIKSELIQANKYRNEDKKDD